MQRVGLKRLGLLLTLVALLFGGPLRFHSQAFDTTLPNRSLLLSDSVATRTGVTYTFGFDTTLALTIGSVEFEICSNDPFPGTSCTVPPGFDISGGLLASQTGTSDFAVDVPSTNAHKLVLSRIASAVSPTTFSFEITGVTNPDDVGTEYMRLRIFNAPSTGGSLVDAAGLAFSINGDLNLATEVPPHLDFCVGVEIASADCSVILGDSVEMGTLTTGATAAVTSEFMVGTNAQNGYIVTVNGFPLTSGNNVITSITTPASSAPGTNQFGINLKQNTVPVIGSEPVGAGSGTITSNYNVPNKFRFVSGETIVSHPTADDFTKFTVSYITNIDSSQDPGIYATTMTYVATGNF